VPFTNLSCGGHESADMMAIDEIKKKASENVAERSGEVGLK
jgi:hypothetical protein